VARQDAPRREHDAHWGEVKRGQAPGDFGRFEEMYDEIADNPRFSRLEAVPKTRAGDRARGRGNTQSHPPKEQ
jgi:hypothetical protein